MKKFLILLLSLFCIKLGAYAVGVDCWEEYTTLETPPATSDLRTAITNAGGTVVKLHTRALTTVYNTYLMYDAGVYGAVTRSINQIYGFNDGNYWDNYALGTAETGDTTTKTLLALNFIGDSDNDSGSGSSRDLYKEVQEPDYYLYTSSGLKRQSDWYYMTHFVHTYCTVNTSSGGGGGATGSVNFIIKATS